MVVDSQEEVIRGTVERLAFKNAQNGYVVLSVKVDQHRWPITVVGTAPTIEAGGSISARGLFKEHPKFGRQFVASSISEIRPTGSKEIERYLASGIIKGIGAETAKRIVDVYGDDTLEILYQEPDRIGEIKGVGKSKARLLSKAFGEQRGLHQVLQFLVGHGVSTGLANRIYERYQNKALEMLNRDPYILAYELKGVGFIKADNIALKIGIALDAPERIRAGLLYALDDAADNGHCYLPEEELITQTVKLLGLSSRSYSSKSERAGRQSSQFNSGDATVGSSPSSYGEAQDVSAIKGVTDPLQVENSLLRHEELDFKAAIGYLASVDKVVVDEFGVHSVALHRAEQIVQGFIDERTQPREKVLIQEATVEEALKEAAESLGITFSDEQRQAVFEAARRRFLVITGGPGCGKTTLIKALSVLFERADMRLLLAAPTGRAAQRMAQVCGSDAKTIHRLLGFDPRAGRFRHGLDEPLEADAVIIDEASMLDVRLASSLFQALDKDMILILVGDKDQLPSVGPGRLFADLIECTETKVIKLSRLYRRDAHSTINDVAHTINAGVVPTIPQPDGNTKADAYFIPRNSPEEAAETIERLIADQLPKKFGFSAEDIMLLTPSNRGPLGTVILNSRLQAKLNPRDERPVVRFGDNELRCNDRVCQRVNNYQIDEGGVFNGDLGKIYEILPNDHGVVVDLWDGRLVKYTSGEISQLSLAYAMTVHRSQGSEIPCVVLALHDSHYMLLERQLIYTAVTRAKKLLVIVGSRRALSLATRRTTASERYTSIRAKFLALKKNSSEDSEGLDTQLYFPD